MVSEAASSDKARDLVRVGGVRRALPRPPRERVQAALEGKNDDNLGGQGPGFSRTSHAGFNFLELSLIGCDGRFRR